jgi:hypothetical protein
MLLLKVEHPPSYVVLMNDKQPIDATEQATFYVYKLAVSFYEDVEFAGSQRLIATPQSVIDVEIYNLNRIEDIERVMLINLRKIYID